MADSDKTKKRRRVALLVETSLGSGREILRGIARYAQQKGQWTLFHLPHGLGEDFRPWLEQWEGDGIVARVADERTAEALEGVGVPVVDVLGVTESLRFPLVHVDDEAIAKEVAHHLLAQGFENFAFYGIKDENWSTRRGLAFARAVGEARPFYPLHLPRSLDRKPNQLLARVRKWLAALPLPAGVMVASDQCALALLEAARLEKIPVPEQMALVGVDNDVPLCEISSPTLSSVRAGHFRVGYEAARKLDALMRGESARDTTLVEPTGVVVRRSSDLRAIQDPVVARGVRYLFDHIGEKVTIADAASFAGVSRTLFQRMFKEETGETFHAFLMRHRINRARRLLESTDLSIAQVAGATGFKHQEYLNNVFRDKLDTTPAEVRRAAQQAEG